MNLGFNPTRVWRRIFPLETGDRVGFWSFSPKGERVFLEGTVTGISKLNKDFYFVRMNSNSECYSEGVIRLIYRFNLTWLPPLKQRESERYK